MAATLRLMQHLDEQSLTCPYCWETIDVLLDLSQPEQVYIEDCAVCCHPIEIQVAAEDGILTRLSGTRIDA